MTLAADALSPGSCRAAPARGAVISWTAIGVSTMTASATPARLPSRTAAIPSTSASQTAAPPGEPRDEAADTRAERRPSFRRGQPRIHLAGRRQRPRRRPGRHDLGRTPQQVQRRLGQLAAHRPEGPLRAPCPPLPIRGAPPAR